jgi:hypothetical protein
MHPSSIKADSAANDSCSDRLCRRACVPMLYLGASWILQHCSYGGVELPSQLSCLHSHYHTSSVNCRARDRHNGRANKRCAVHHGTHVRLRYTYAKPLYAALTPVVVDNNMLSAAQDYFALTHACRHVAPVRRVPHPEFVCFQSQFGHGLH